MESPQMTRHLFHAIDELFRPNNKYDITREEPISLKNIRKGDAAWSTQKVVLGWVINTVNQVLTLSDNLKNNQLALIKITPPSVS